jgi:hypothetical protein
MRELLNTKAYMIIMGFLLIISNQLTAQLKQDIAGKKVTLDDQVLEIKKEIVGGGTIDLLDATTERIDGICSFDKNNLQTGRAFVFDGIALNYKSDAASGKEGSLSYNAAAPAELQNALFILSQDGREVLRIPVRELNNITTGFSASDEYHKLKSLRYLVDNRQITMQIKFPPTVVLSGATKHYVYVRLSGLQTTKKPN